MGISVAQYDETPVLTVEWDLQLRQVEQRVEKAQEDQQ